MPIAGGIAAIIVATDVIKIGRSLIGPAIIIASPGVLPGERR